MGIENYNYFDEAETNIDLDEFQDLNDFISRSRQPKDLGFFPTNVAQNPAMVKYGITSLPEFDMANLPMYEKDDEQDQEYIDQVNQSSNKFGGIMDLLMGIAIPGYGLFKNIAKGGLDGLKGFNQRLQQSDFAQSDNLMDYLDMRKYGGAQGRDDFAARNMAQARGIQNKIDTGEYKRTAADNVIDRGRTQESRAAATRSKDLGSMRGGVGR
jgi:hypothetical protein